MPSPAGWPRGRSGSGRTGGVTFPDEDDDPPVGFAHVVVAKDEPWGSLLAHAAGAADGQAIHEGLRLWCA